MNFENKTALITGAAVGIGRAAAINFARHGASLILLDLDIEKLESVKAELSEYTSDVRIFKCDVSDEVAVNKIADEVGTVDILVNNAALWRCWSEFIATPTDEWKKFLDINIMGVVYVTRAFLPGMLEKKYGRIINIGSVAGVYGNRNMADYSMTKGAVSGFTKALAKEVSGSGITVNTVSPGNIKLEGEVDNLNLSFIQRSGTTDECANVVCFLASDDASFVSGQNYLVDGCRKAM